jgi:hypothetical protein
MSAANTLLQGFEALGDSLRSLWRERELDPEHFPRLAADALRNFSLPSNWSLDRLIRDIARSRRAQPKGHPFGDLQIRVFDAHEFYAEVLVWLDGTTVIHEHGFSGAFRVLEGGSIHSRFVFHQEGAVSPRLRVGRAHLLDAELLRVNDVREIRRGPQTTHAVFHLERPSVTLVVRTHSEQWWAPQANIYRPSIAMDYTLLQDSRVAFAAKSVRAFLRHPDRSASSLFIAMLQELDLPRAFALCVALVDSGLLQEVQTAEAIRSRFGMLGERAAECLAYEMRTLEYARLRRAVHSPDDRFVLALLATVPSVEKVRALLQQRFDSADGQARLARLICMLLERQGFRFRADAAAAIETVELILRQRSRAACLAAADAVPEMSSGSARRAQLTEVYEALRDDVMLRGVWLEQDAM